MTIPGAEARVGELCKQLLQQVVLLGAPPTPPPPPVHVLKFLGVGVSIARNLLFLLRPLCKLGLQISTSGGRGERTAVAAVSPSVRCRFWLLKS